jgi:hypothetical protein
VTAAEAAKVYLDRVHQGNPAKALWTARRREHVLEPLPRDAIRAQEGFAWVAATCGLEGVTVTDEGGAVVLVAWHDVLPPTPIERIA